MGEYLTCEWAGVAIFFRVVILFCICWGLKYGFSRAIVATTVAIIVFSIGFLFATYNLPFSFVQTNTSSTEYPPIPYDQPKTWLNFGIPIMAFVAYAILILALLFTLLLRMKIKCLDKWYRKNIKWYEWYTLAYVGLTQLAEYSYMA